MLNDAQRFWDAIVGKVRRTAQDESKNALRLERYEVTTAANGTKMGVTLPMGTKEIFLPYSNEVASAGVGTPVLVGWWGSMSNAKVYYFADGYKGGLAARPIGSFYISEDSTSPAEIFGGMWQRITGQFLFGTDTTETNPGTYPAGSTGGEAEHTLTADESGQKELTITGGGHSHTVRAGAGSISQKQQRSTERYTRREPTVTDITELAHPTGRTPPVRRLRIIPAPTRTR